LEWDDARWEEREEDDVKIIPILKSEVPHNWGRKTDSIMKNRLQTLHVTFEQNQ
jgi:hypothetical protein